jgi:8-oxo-dGTP pyrophosphatase MutT (NUDIX family)
MSRSFPFGRPSLAISLAARAWLTPVCFGAHAILECDDGTIVLVRHRYTPGLCFPGGGVGAGEPPGDAILRELSEEVGLKSATALPLFGLYTRKVGWTTNLVALYHVRAANIEFRPNMEISEIVHVDQRNPPPETSPATRRRVAEFIVAASVSG